VYLSTKGGECSYRSGWELAYLFWLDANARVKSFEYEKVVIPYVSNVKTGRVRKYYPDVLVTYFDGSRHLVEIKPKKRLIQTMVKKKLAAAQQWCLDNGVTLEIVTEVELKDLGILS